MMFFLIFEHELSQMEEDNSHLSEKDRHRLECTESHWAWNSESRRQSWGGEQKQDPAGSGRLYIIRSALRKKKKKGRGLL